MILIVFGPELLDPYFFHGTYNNDLVPQVVLDLGSML